MRYRIPRFPADTALTLECAGNIYNVRLVNISTTGARLEGLDSLARNARVTLHYLHERVPAHVVWSKSRRTGVRFVMAVSQSMVDALRGVGGRSLSAWSSSGQRFRELS